MVAVDECRIEECHPIDAWQLEDNVKDGVLVKTTLKQILPTMIVS